MFVISVTVYSKPRCVQCGAVKRWLTERGIEFAEANLPDLPEKLEHFKSLGLMQAPVVEIDGMEPFAGFNITALEEAERNGLLR